MLKLINLILRNVNREMKVIDPLMNSVSVPLTHDIAYSLVYVLVATDIALRTVSSVYSHQTVKRLTADVVIILLLISIVAVIRLII